MGRLQRKKPAFRPKRKENGAETEGVRQVGNGSSATSNGAAAAPLAENRRRQPAVQKPARAPRAYPGRESVEKAMQFLREVRVELRKVTWPSRKQTVGSTAVVIVLVMIIALFLGVVDMGLSKLAQVVLQ